MYGTFSDQAPTRVFILKLPLISTLPYINPSVFAGISAPPTSVQNHEPLPLARLVSIVMFPDLPVNDPLWTLVTMSWGQVITHDMSMALGTAQASKFSNYLARNRAQKKVRNLHRVSRTNVLLSRGSVGHIFVLMNLSQKEVLIFRTSLNQMLRRRRPTTLQ